MILVDKLGLADVIQNAPNKKIARDLKCWELHRNQEEIEHKYTTMLIYGKYCTLFSPLLTTVYCMTIF